MELKVKAMGCAEAKQISQWTYQEPYAVYSMEDGESCRNELLNGTYFAVSDETDRLVGYFCFGAAAQVPVGHRFGVYEDRGLTDIGLGIEPALCGQGLGADFLRKGLEFGRDRLSAKGFRLTVAAFNERAIKVYQRAGFVKVASFERVSENGPMKFDVMILA